MLRRLLTSVVDHQAVEQEGDGGLFLVGHVNPHRCVTRSTISTCAAFCIILWRRHEGLHVIMDALPVTEDSVHQCRWHNMFVSRLVLWAWVKATVGVGELLTHHYGSLNHPVNCKHTTSTLTLNLAYITISSTKQAVSSFDAEGLEWLESFHDQLESITSTKLLITVALLPS